MDNENKGHGPVVSTNSGKDPVVGECRIDSDAYKQLFIEEVHGHQDRYDRIVEFTQSTTRAAGIMLAAAIAALVIANTAVAEPFIRFTHVEVGFIIGQTHMTMSIAHVINDILMAVFFLLVGLEIKYEMTVGELTNIRQALLPIIAAIGGVLAPVLVYSLVNSSNPETSSGWGVPTATDIAFALGVMALLGDRIPNGIKVFLSTLAVADDIIAILVIAIFYGHAPSVPWLGCAAVVMALLILINKRHVYSLVPYLLLGVVLWLFIFMSGVHSTIAGVLLAFVIPSGSRVNLTSFIDWSGKKLYKADAAFDANTPVIGQKEYMRNVRNLSAIASQVIPPATRLEHKLYPWVYFAILPLFALTNANVTIPSDVGSVFSNPAFVGVFLGLVLGKPAGILAASALVVRFGLADLPDRVNWKHMIGAAILGGVGFTMAIFVANLAYASEAAMISAKMAILIASGVAAAAGFIILFLQARKATRECRRSA